MTGETTSATSGDQGGGGDADRVDRGSAVLVLLVSLAFCAAAMSGLVAVNAELQRQARARTAADAAALAAVHGGDIAAAAIAEANGAELVSVLRTGLDVVVEVRVGGTTSSARATNAP